LVSRAGLAGGGSPNQASYQWSFFMTVGMKKAFFSEEKKQKTFVRLS
jgi:hypothetical protein